LLEEINCGKLIEIVRPQANVGLLWVLGHNIIVNKPDLDESAPHGTYEEDIIFIYGRHQIGEPLRGDAISSMKYHAD